MRGCCLAEKPTNSHATQAFGSAWGRLVKGCGLRTLSKRTIWSKSWDMMVMISVEATPKSTLAGTLEIPGNPVCPQSGPELQPLEPAAAVAVGSAGTLESPANPVCPELQPPEPAAAVAVRSAGAAAVALGALWAQGAGAVVPTPAAVGASGARGQGAWATGIPAGTGMLAWPMAGWYPRSIRQGTVPEE